MKIRIFFAALLCLFFKGEAQVNYVLNADLEDHSACPFDWNQIKYANYWSPIDTLGDPDFPQSLPVGCAEYCNICAGANAYAGVPINVGFNHYPRSGGGMVQAEVYFNEAYAPEAYQRDYVQGRLYKKLTAGTRYCVTFYVSLDQVSGYAINNIGAYLDDGSIDAGQDSVSCAAPQTGFTPQILETAIINDTLDWVKVQDNFTATGNEQFITIGNFFDKAHTLISLTTTGNDFSWYLIDDVSVIDTVQTAQAGPDGFVSPGSDSAYIGTPDRGMPCTWYVAGSPTPIAHTAGLMVHPDTTTTYVLLLDIKNHVTYDTVVVWTAAAGVGPPGLPGREVAVWPNPAGDEIMVEHAEGNEMGICSLLGQEVYKTIISSDKETVSIRDLPPGTYIVQLVSGDGRKQNFRVVKG